MIPRKYPLPSFSQSHQNSGPRHEISDEREPSDIPLSNLQLHKKADQSCLENPSSTRQIDTSNITNSSYIPVEKKFAVLEQQGARNVNLDISAKTKHERTRPITDANGALTAEDQELVDLGEAIKNERRTGSRRFLEYTITAWTSRLDF